MEQASTKELFLGLLIKGGKRLYYTKRPIMAGKDGRGRGTERIPVEHGDEGGRGMRNHSLLHMSKVGDGHKTWNLG